MSGIGADTQRICRQTTQRGQVSFRGICCGALPRFYRITSGLTSANLASNEIKIEAVPVIFESKMDTALKLDIEKKTYELRCMAIHSEGLEKSLADTKEHINKFGMSPDVELGLARLELRIERHELDTKEKRMELMFLYKRSLTNERRKASVSPS